VHGLRGARRSRKGAGHEQWKVDFVVYAYIPPWIYSYILFLGCITTLSVTQIYSTERECLFLNSVFVLNELFILRKT
jgi:hypothetical protein